MARPDPRHSPSSPPAATPKPTPSRASAIAKRAYNAAYLAITALFAICALALIGFAGFEIWRGIDLALDTPISARFTAILEGIGLLTIAVASLELSQTVLEEEVQREALMSAPTRARRFLSRFMLVVVVSVSVEYLVLVFRLIHEDPGRLLHAASLGISAAFLLAAWGLFVHLNRSVEELEPEAMEEAKREDQDVH